MANVFLYKMSPYIYRDKSPAFIKILKLMNGVMGVLQLKSWGKQDSSSASWPAFVRLLFAFRSPMLRLQPKESRTKAV